MLFDLNEVAGQTSSAPLQGHKVGTILEYD